MQRSKTAILQQYYNRFDGSEINMQYNRINRGKQ